MPPNSWFRAAVEFLDAYRLWRAGHPDEAGLLMAMGDWWAEISLILEESAE